MVLEMINFKTCECLIYIIAMHAYCDDNQWVVIKDSSKMNQRPPTPTLWKLVHGNMYLIFISVYMQVVVRTPYIYIYMYIQSCKCCLALTRLCLAVDFTGGNFPGDASHYSHCIWVWVLSNPHLASGFICINFVWNCPSSTVVIFFLPRRQNTMQLNLYTVFRPRLTKICIL